MEQVFSPALTFLTGGGEMAEATRRYDWANSTLGSPEFWPQSLRTTLGIIYNSKFPMFLWWGDELIQFYNDAYRPSLGNNGKHPKALGQRGEECWTEIWPVIKPLIDQVLSGGGSTWSEDQLIPIYRNGRLEDVYWTFSYSLVNDESDSPAGVLVTCMETTGKVLASKKIKESEKNLRSMIRQSPVAMCILSGSEHIVKIANEGIYEIWGKKAEDVDNKPIFEGLPEAKDQGLEELLWQVYTTGESYHASEWPVLLPRNDTTETTYINFAYLPMREPDDSISGVMVVAIEVTDLVLARMRIEDVVAERTTEYQKAVEELTKRNQDLEQFAYVASHDLKEPLRMIGNYSDLLMRHVPMDTKAAEYSGFITDGIGRMRALIKDLLDYSQVGQTTSSQVQIDCNTLLGSVKDNLRLRIDETDTAIHYADLPCITGIYSLLSQLFQNLIDNAIKFKKENTTPEIFIEATKKGNYWLFSVRDNGIGIDPAYKEKIFIIFQRLHQRDKYPGTGIGLAICRRIVDFHGGKIWFDSTLGKGATFYFTLPTCEQ